MKKQLYLALLFVAMNVCGQAQTVFNVPSSSFSTIQAAVNAASNGDTIVVAAGTYFENINISNKSITLQGAGIGQSILDGGGIGSVLKVTDAASFDLDGFTIQNGLGDIWYAGSPTGPGWSSGGGVYAIGSTSSPSTPSYITIKHCHFDSNSAFDGGGIWAFNGVFLTVEDSLFTNNSTVIAPGAIASGAPAIRGLQNLTLTIRRCEFAQNTLDGNISATITLTAGSLLIEDSEIHNNDGWGVLTTGLSTLDGVTLHDNETGGVYFGQNSNGQRHLLRNSLIYSHNDPQTIAAVFTKGNVDIEGCTIVDNVGATTLNSDVGGAPMTGGGVVGMSKWGTIPTVVNIINSIVYGNLPADTVRFIPPASIQPPPQALPPGVPGVGIVFLSINYSCTGPSIENAFGVANTTLDPMFVDPLAQDYRLDPLSPAINNGDVNSPDIAPVDILGSPRVVFGVIDMGVYENTHVGLGPFFNGNVGPSPANLFFDLLKINGTAGDLVNRVTVPIGSSSTMTLDQPYTNPMPSNFLIFALWGEPTVFDSYTLPGTIGDMAFVPCPAAPSLSALTFVYAGSFVFGTGCNPLFLTGPTPWNSGPSPAIFFPLKLTFQGVIEETPGVYKVTNGIIWELK